MISPDRDEFFIQLRVPCRRSIDGTMTGELFAPAVGFSVNQNENLIDGSELSCFGSAAMEL
jgi:hypothetical protein